MTSYIDTFKNVFNNALTIEAVRFMEELDKLEIKGDWTERKETNRIKKAATIACITPDQFIAISDIINGAVKELNAFFMDGSYPPGAYQYLANFMGGAIGIADSLESLV